MNIATWRESAAELDARDMRGHIARLPEQISEAVTRSAPFADSVRAGKASAIAVLGMGGSAMGADLAAAYTADRRALPWVTLRDYTLPAWLDRRAVAIASSYSGNTEETLAAYEEAKRRGLTTIAVTTGGRLGELARANGDPLLELPTGFPPRAALGHSFTAVALVAARLDPGLDAVREGEAIARLPEALAPLARDWLAWDEGNPALEIAAGVAERLAVMYAGHPIGVAAARRWKTQLNENGKIPAYWSEFPEHNHNEIVGFEGESPVAARLALIYLETPWENPRVVQRMDFVHSACRDVVGWQRRVRDEALAPTPLESMFRLCYLGDCASFFTSIVTGRDPTPVASIDRLKSVLSKA